MTVLYSDLETFSPIDLKRCGTHAYAEQAEILLFPYALDDGEVKCWQPGYEIIPDELYATLADDSITTVWQNGGMFDLTILNHAGFLYGIPWLPHSRVFDTMACALAHSLPAGLGVLGDVLGVKEDKAKHKTGQKLIQLFCKPRPKNSELRRATRETHPAEWQQFIDYAKADVSAMREVYKKLPKWNYQPGGFEYDLWLLDQKINQRGVAVDIDLARGAVASADKAKVSLAKRANEMTNGEVNAATQRDALLKHIFEEYGIPLPNLQMATIERRLNDPDIPEPLKDLLKVRLQASTTSVSKYNTLLRAVSPDGRLRGLLQFSGAGRTGRWAGRIIQPQNLMRPTLKQPAIDLGVEVIKADACELFYDDVMEVVSNCVRGCFIAPPGRKLVVSDLANIEGRVAAWLTGEQWKLKAFREYDAGEGPDLYCVSYGKSFGVDPYTVEGRERQIGKTCLAEGSLVMVESGWKRIEEVTLKDRLWDGVEWVHHKGLLSQGLKSVIDLDALYITADHLVLCGTQWREAGTLLRESTALSLALATAEGVSPSQGISSGGSEPSLPFLLPATAGGQNTALQPTTSRQASAAGAANVRGWEAIKSSGGTLMPCLKRRTVHAFCKDLLRRACAVPQKKTRGGPTTGGEALKSATFGWLTKLPFSNISERFLGGTILLWRWIAATRIKGTNPGISDSSPSCKTTPTEGQSETFRQSATPYERKMLTYDLACAGPRSRFTVKTQRGALIVHNCELMLQYQGRVGAFVTGAATYRIDLEMMATEVEKTVPIEVWEESQGFLDWTIKQKMPTYDLSDKVFIACNALTVLWREAHPMISSYWKELQNAYITAVEHPGTTITARMLKFRRDGAWLRIRLPSGRCLCYPSPKVEEGVCSYMGTNQYTKKWERQLTYGGKLFENICQGVARDVMAYAMPEVEKQGFEIVLTVHDELITEAPDLSDFSVTALSNILSAGNIWTGDMPLAAAGFEAYRYRKE